VQRGQIFKDHGSWFVRFYEGEKRVTKRLGYVENYPTKRAIEPLAQECIRKVNQSSNAGITLDEFLERMYLPYAKEHLRASTSKGYADIWRVHIAGKDEAQLRVREYRTIDVQALLNVIADDTDLTKTTLQHIKAFLSGVFRYAAVCGIRDGNPVRECLIPKKSRPAGATQAYTLGEIRLLLNVLPLLPKAAVATAAFAGLRLSELHGLEWTDYNGETITIKQSMWPGIKNPPKSIASGNYVPVIPALKAILDAYRQTLGNPTVGPVFPVELEHLGNRAVRAAMDSLGLRWSGWHGFRRGIASNLFELGCDDLTVQRVLRHSKVQVTREKYIKVRDAKLESAMEALSQAFGQQIGST
jgi:integrase